MNWTYELGFRFSTKYVSGDIAYFYDDYSDYEITVPITALGFKDGSEYSEKVLGISKAAQLASGKNFTQTRSNTYLNGPNVVFQGFDTSLDINPTKDWQVTLSYLFQRSIVGNNNPFDFGQGTPQQLFLAADGIPVGPKFENGNRIEFMPTHIFKVGSNYTFPFGLRMDVEGRYKSSTNFTTAIYPGGILPQPDHWIWDLKMAQPLFNGKAKLTFSIENVFSKLYFENGEIPSNVARYVWGLETKF